MNVVHIIALVLALVGVVPAITLLSPFKVAHRAVPAIMIAASLALWFLPSGIDVALAAVPVAAYISAKLGIEHAGHDAADYSPAIEKAKTVAQATREKVRPSKPVEIQQFVDRAYPNPESAAEDEPEPADAAVESDSDAGEPAPEPTLSEKMSLAAAGLPAEYQAKLAGQRAGRMVQPSLRNQTVSTVRKFVPSLID